MIFRSHMLKIILATCLITAAAAGQACALEPAEVLVVANRNAASSKGLAMFYMERRNIPKENLVQLFMTDKETCSRDDYQKKRSPPSGGFWQKTNRSGPS